MALAFVCPGVVPQRSCCQGPLQGPAKQGLLRRRGRNARACLPSEMPGVPSKLGALAARIAECPRRTQRYLALIELGKRLPQLPEHLRSEDTRVQGCTSTVHVHVTRHQYSANRVRLAGAADAQVARGFLALLMLGLDGAQVHEVLALKLQDLANAVQLELSLAPSRAVGFASILDALQARVRSLVAIHEHGDTQPVNEPVSSALSAKTSDLLASEPAAIRWSSVQPQDVAMLLSGGVDSSVAMRLIMESGARPRPYYLKIWLEDELAHLGECPWEEDIAYATAVCEQAGVSLETVPLQREYWDRVVSYTIAEARAGRTPNPDVICNSRIKFGAFFDKIGQHYQSVATGHYARTEANDATGLVQLRVSSDSIKDQTYFLAHLSQRQLARVEFPVGAYCKDDVRVLASKYDLPNRARKDSQGICFLGKLKFDDFLEFHLGSEAGPMVEYETGVTVGIHKGFWFYTLGQRKGLGLSGGPWYVASKDPTENTVYVTRRYDDPDKTRDVLEFAAVSWISGSWPEDLGRDGASCELQVKTRHGPNFVYALVTRKSSSTGEVQLRSRDKGLAPGQFVAFYRDGICLGSGIIASDRELLHAHRRSGELARKTLQAHRLAPQLADIFKEEGTVGRS
jgi:tRNA-5-taurinomethyluridine 2-sulfurtransferase